MKGNKLNAFGVAFMYVGSIMGAGFASGRESWQFFGVFAQKGYIGIAIAGVLFIAMGVMTGCIARRLSTNDMGRVIVPGGTPAMTTLVGRLMALMLFTVLITMSAAGGAIFHQQFGLSRVLGGALIIALVVVTVIGGFDRVAHVFRYMMPVLVIVIISVSIAVIIGDLPESQIAAERKPSPLSPDWRLSAILYVSYNILAVVPIVATSSIHAKNGRHALWGGALGGVLVTLLVSVLVVGLNTDGNLAQTMDMPMLAFAGKLSPVLGMVYTCILLMAVYGSATSNYYGFTTGLKERPGKKRRIVIIAGIGFLLGLVGFKNVVAYMFPLEGFFGIAIIIMVMVNFMKTRNSEQTIDTVFGKAHDRFAFPAGIMRVTARKGGEAILILGDEKTALVDCGLACFGPQLVSNIRAALSSRPLDYVLMSHTHYDHIGAFPYIRKAFPEVTAYGSKRGQEILQREGALRLIRELGESAGDTYMKGVAAEAVTEGLSVDRVLADGDRVSLGEWEITALETKGHTDCSMTFVLEPLGLMFTSESTGILKTLDYVHTPILKSYRESIASLEICRAYDPNYIVLPHFGILPPEFNREYWDLFFKCAEEKKQFIYEIRELEEGQRLERYLERYWTSEEEMDQPKEAFELNAKLIIRAIMKEF